MTQAADPKVSRRKFEREVGRLRSSERMLTQRGIWVTEAEFPIVKIAFMTTRMTPRIMALAVRIDYSDYDIRPPSVKFWDPFEDRELLTSELQTQLPKQQGNVPLPNMPNMLIMPSIQIVTLAQSYGPNMPAFLCLPGVREYHDHPAHTGDAWELYRRQDGGALFDLVDTLWRYGAAPLNQFMMQMTMRPQQTEFPA